MKNSEFETVLTNRDWEQLQEALKNPEYNEKLAKFLEEENVLDK